MNDFKLCQIYHVARCGSTLITSLLSATAPTYSEPVWGHSLNGVLSTPENIHQYNGSIVKFSSINTSIGFKPEGPKVFLYRPLVQYLSKMEQCGRPWLEIRKQIYGTHFDQIRKKELESLYPENAMQLHTIFWASCILEMQKYNDVLWIQSNDFFLNKEPIAKKVLGHFEISGEPDMRYAKVNVKKLKLNGEEISPFEQYNTVESCSTDYGIIENSQGLENDQILETIEWAKCRIPFDFKFVL